MKKLKIESQIEFNVIHSHFNRLKSKQEKLMPITLIIPPSPFLLDERVFMHLGILKIAAVLETVNYPMEILDLSGVDNYLDVVTDYVKKFPRIYGITATTPQMPSAYNIAKRIKQMSDSKIILGGPHATLTNAACKQELKLNQGSRGHQSLKKLTDLFDVIVAGDGEFAIFEALAQTSPKIIDADDQKSSLFLSNENFTSLPIPARHLIDVSSYHYSIEGIPALSLIAQLGCPFGCNFCGGRHSPFLRKIRTRSIQSIISEMEHMYLTYGTKGFMLYDDELNVNRQVIKLMESITRLQEKHKTEFRLRGFVKSELFNADQARAMYNAGFRWILVGFESGSNRILTNMNKSAKKEQNDVCINIAHRANLKVKALMSIGHPGESLETLTETTNWLIASNPNDFDISIITPYPGSPYYDHAIKENNLFVFRAPKTGDALYQKELDYTEIFDYYKGNPDGGYTCHIHTDYLLSEDIIKHRDKMEKEVRARLNLPFNPIGSNIKYEHSMGQTVFPKMILNKPTR